MHDQRVSVCVTYSRGPSFCLKAAAAGQAHRKGSAAVRGPLVQLLCVCVCVCVGVWVGVCVCCMCVARVSKVYAQSLAKVKRAWRDKGLALKTRHIVFRLRDFQNFILRSILSKNCQ